MMSPVTALADAVLPLIRTRADVWRWSIADAHGARMHEAVAILRQAAEDDDPAEVFAVTQRAIASALKVIMRADDSSGIIGNACYDLLELHSIAAARSRPAPTKLVDWMVKFQFDDECDYFTIDPVAYAPALGPDGMAAYRVKLDERAVALGPPTPENQFSHARVSLEWNAQRLAVFDRDVDAIIRTHARDRRVAAWLKDTATALMEIGEIDAAIDWAKQATDFDDGHQARRAADYWCELLAEHRADELLGARVEVFRRWPSSTTAGYLYRDARVAWPDYEDEVLAWNLAHSLGLADARTWSDLVKAYEKLDPLAVLPIHTELVEGELAEADARNYRNAARRLKKMRTLAAGSSEPAVVDELIADLRDRYRRRPRLQQEFDRAGLP
jgi:tetratricopeptide (TPR) repeat protein